MATTIRDKNFFTLVANDIGKSPKMVSNYLDAVIDRIVKEALRGNSVSIKNFGFFRPVMKGGKEIRVIDEMKYVEPRLTLKYQMNDNMLKRLNTEISKEEERELATNDRNFDLTARKRDKRNKQETENVKTKKGNAT